MTRAGVASADIPGEGPLVRVGRGLSLVQHPNADLPSTLEAAMQRTYSASPYQSFLTGSGTQTFSNFDKTTTTGR